ncbi:hypothetical protein [uncultured Dialister sp.]|uniref:hypothetical protein n=1 Tax=uncultured Dialister sp. TaxID=278064 RepID=UPI0025FB615D|nr:hypothetical protein [uncultured Dialister sp.]
MRKEYTYRCPTQCPFNKHCFIIKTEAPIKNPIPILKKCPCYKKDISVWIGNVPPEIHEVQDEDA